jgi:hypothetical protein
VTDEVDTESRTRLNDLPDRDRVLLALRRYGFRLAVIDYVARRSKRSLVDDDAVGRRLTLEARRSVDDVARRHALACEWLRSKSHERLTRRDSDPNLYAFLIQRPVANRQRRPNCAFRVVLVRDGSTEKADDGITDELLHRPTVSLNLCAHMPPIGFLQRTNILGVKSLPRCGEVDQVGEQDADDFPLFTR